MTIVTMAQISFQALKIKTHVKMIVMLVGHLLLLQTLKLCTERNTLNISMKIKRIQTLNSIFLSKRSLIAFQLNHHVATGILRIVLLLQESSLVFHSKKCTLNTMHLIQIHANDLENEMQTLNQ